jgi:hypothetical protein
MASRCSAAWLGFAAARDGPLRSPDLMQDVPDQVPETCSHDLDEDGENGREDGSGRRRNGDGGSEHLTPGPVGPEASIDVGIFGRHGGSCEMSPITA